MITSHAPGQRIHESFSVACSRRLQVNQPDTSHTFPVVSSLVHADAYGSPPSSPAADNQSGANRYRAEESCSTAECRPEHAVSGEPAQSLRQSKSRVERLVPRVFSVDRVTMRQQEASPFTSVSFLRLKWRRHNPLIVTIVPIEYERAIQQIKPAIVVRQRMVPPTKSISVIASTAVGLAEYH